MTAMTLELCLDAQAAPAEDRARDAPAAPPPVCEPEPSRQGPPPAAPLGGATLDAVIVGAWAKLSAQRTADCPACGGTMHPRYGSGSWPVGGRCADCGSMLG